MSRTLYAILFIVYQVNSQKFGLGSFPLPYERFGPCSEIPYGPNIGPIAQPCLPSSCSQNGQLLNIPVPSFNGQNIVPVVTPCQNIVPPCQSCQQIVPPCQSCQQIIPPCQSCQQVVPPYQSNIVPPCQTCQQIGQPCQKTCLSAPIVPSIPTIPCNGETAVIDNTLANSLANAIQLLIVSNLLENTLGQNCGSYPITTVNTCDVPCLNNVIDLVSPDYYSCDPYDGYIEVPCISEPVITCQAPCVDINPFTNDCGCSSVPISFSTVPNSCSSVPISFSSVPNTCSNVPISFSMPNSCSTVPSFANNQFTCVDGLVGSFAPVAAEFLIPSAIPAQLTCNFGYMPTTVPCVSVNVEPLPFQNGLYF